MEFFKYDTNDPRAEQYELLQSLMENWEDEIVEFKTASGQYSIDKIGQYFSAISNEANLMNQQYGWLVLGVSETDKKHVVGTAFKEGTPQLLGKFKYDISKDITDGMTFMEIIELFPRNEENEPKRVLMFKVPAAIAGMPTAWKNQYFARSGESLVRLNQQKIDAFESFVHDMPLEEKICQLFIENLEGKRKGIHFFSPIRIFCLQACQNNPSYLRKLHL